MNTRGTARIEAPGKVGPVRCPGIVGDAPGRRQQFGMVCHCSVLGALRGGEDCPCSVPRRDGPADLLSMRPGALFEGAMTRVYEYDVFISYRRIGSDVPGWIRNHFYPRLSEVLDNNLDRDVKIFFDELVPSGATWPTELRTALQRARILLPVCSPKYFVDEWCLAEWKSMELREKLAGMASPEQHPQNLIYGVIFSDSETFPKFATDRRMRNFKSWNHPHRQFER